VIQIATVFVALGLDIRWNHSDKESMAVLEFLDDLRNTLETILQYPLEGGVHDGAAGRAVRVEPKRIPRVEKFRREVWKDGWEDWRVVRHLGMRVVVITVPELSSNEQFNGWLRDHNEALRKKVREDGRR